MDFSLKYSWLFSALACLVFLSIDVDGQVIKRQSLGTLGGSLHAGSLTIQQTVGQPSITSSTYSGSSSLRSGFMQPTVILESLVTGVQDLKVYPIPTATNATLLYRLKANDIIEIRDVKSIVVKKYELDSEQESWQLELFELSSGVYFIIVVRQGSAIGIAKIIKE